MNLNDTELIDRRRNQRRGSSETTVEQRGTLHSALEKTSPPPAPTKGTEQRTGKDRRVAERRQRHIGPPAGVGERRFQPDLRGVVFPIYYNFN